MHIKQALVAKQMLVVASVLPQSVHHLQLRNCVALMLMESRLILCKTCR